MSFLGFWSEEAGSFLLTPAGNIVFIAAILILLIVAAKLGGKNHKFSAKSLAFCALAMALATVTSFIKFINLPMGGSFTLFSMFFICFTGYLYGAKVGIITGVAYGLLQLIIDPYIVHPAQLVIDYPLAFGALGLAGILRKSKNRLIKGVLLGTAGRYICHVITGVIFFGIYTPEGMNPLLYSITYNATYIVPELILTVIVLSVPAVKNALKTVKNMA
ncbi:MAG: energy-coupled thiamine transporter ThiT [Lachnospiraceae bacterium]|nr:energy-coupled thiamine transporter ThiT [Lachnospiraceae bacterium]